MDKERLPENSRCVFYEGCNHIDCDTFCMKRWKTAYYFKAGFISHEMSKKFPLYLDKDLIDEQAFITLKNIEDNITQFVATGGNLYIHSANAGNGKTSWALRLARAYIDKEWSNKELRPIVMFISIPRFIMEIKVNIDKKSDYIETLMDNITKSDLIIWDDIAFKSATEFEASNLLRLIDDRLQANKANIYTSNVTGEEFHELSGDRLYSRVYNSSTIIEFKGKDKRGIKESYEID